MWSITIKELRQFFGGLTGYVAIILFLVVTGVFLFVLDDSSILAYGYATLDKFFELAPWVFLFLVPAISMRSLPDEFRAGTFETLKTQPLTATQIATGKFWALLVVILFIIVPTLIYLYTIHDLIASGSPDYGGIAGSYIGLFCMAATFAAVSLACGSFTGNAVAAFLISVFVCLLLYYGFAALSKLPVFRGNSDYYIELLGVDFHYKSMSRGVIDTRDVIYFLSMIFLALYITVKNIKRS